MNRSYVEIFCYIGLYNVALSISLGSSQIDFDALNPSCPNISITYIISIEISKLSIDSTRLKCNLRNSKNKTKNFAYRINGNTRFF